MRNRYFICVNIQSRQIYRSRQNSDFQSKHSLETLLEKETVN